MCMNNKEWHSKFTPPKPSYFNDVHNEHGFRNLIPYKPITDEYKFALKEQQRKAEAS